MAWTGWPISTSGVALNFDIISQLYIEARKRVRAFTNPPYCDNKFPRRGQDYFNSTVSSITATTVTVAAGAFSTDHDLVTSLGGGDTLPSSFDLIIDDEDPRKVVRAAISDNVGAVLTVADMTDYVTGKWISSIGSLAGKKCFIIRRNWPWYAGHFEDDRWPEIPNDKTLYNGSCSGGTESTGAHTGDSYAEDASANWAVDQWAGKYLFVYAGGLLRRVSIGANSKTRLYFSAVAWTAGGSYSIASSTARNWPGKLGGKFWKWYAGKTENLQGVAFDGSIVGSAFAVATVDVNSGTPPFCSTDPQDAKDIDVWTAADDGCNPDMPYTIHFYKSLRAIQVWLLDYCTKFVEMKSYDGERSIPNFNAATFLHSLSINSGTSSVAGTEPNYYFSITRPYPGAGAYWAILNDDGSVLTSGFAAIDVANKIILPDLDTPDIGKTVVWSYGFDRRFHRAFRRLYYQTCFIPDLNGTSVVDPPTCPTYPGTWTRRSPSTTYCEVNDDGIVNDDGPAFANGDYARLIGHNLNDGNIAGTISTTSYSADLEYQKRFCVMNHEKDDQKQIDAKRTGTATAGGTTWLRCANGWFDPIWLAGGVMKTHSGTATAGTSTSLTTTGISGTCFFASGRFVGLNPFENFVLEFDRGATTHHVRITSVSGNTFNFESIGVTPIAGDAWRLKEPYESNRYEGRTITITETNGTTHTATITANDDDTLFFSSIGVAVLAGWTFQISEVAVNAVLHRVSGSWVEAPSQTEPTFVHNYGLARKRDIVTLDLYNQLYEAMDALQWTKGTFDWTANGEDNGCGKSAGLPGRDFGPASAGFVSPDDNYSDSWDAYVAYQASIWGDPVLGFPPPTVFGPVDQAPTAALNSTAGTALIGSLPIADWGHIPEQASVTSYAYPTISAIPVCLPCTIQCLCYAIIKAGDPDEGVVLNWADVWAGGSSPHVSTYEENKFDANGTPLLFRQYATVDTFGSAQTASRTSANKVGNIDTDVPNWTKPPDPIPHQYDYDAVGYAVARVNSGFVITDSTAIFKWDMS